MPDLKTRVLAILQMARGLDRFERALASVIIVGVLLRGITFWTQVPHYDGTAYVAEAHSLARGLGFVAPWGSYDNVFSSTPEPTGLGPIYPIYLAIFYRIVGFSISVTQIAGILLGILVLAVAYLAGRNLYGRTTGLLTCAVLSANPLLVIFPGWAWSDNLPVLFAIVAVWGLVRGIRTDWLLGFPIAGFGLALFALTKAQNLGFGIPLIAALVFAGWRFIESGRKTILERRTVMFIVAFLAPIMSWLVLGPHVGSRPPLASPSAADILVSIVIKLVFVVYSIGFTLAFFLPELARAGSRWESEEGRVLWLAGLGICGIVWFLLVSDYASGRVLGSLWRTEQARHVVAATVPFVWLVSPLRRSGVDIGSICRIRKRNLRWLLTVVLLGAIPAATWFGSYLDGLFLLFFAMAVQLRPTRGRLTMLLVLSMLLAADGGLLISRAPDDNAGLWLQANVKSGNIVALDPWYANSSGGPIYKYELYPYLGDKGVVVVPYEPGSNATYVLSWRTNNITGYQLVGSYGWTSRPGPLLAAWEWVVDTAYVALGREVPAPDTPIVWVLERLP